MEWRSKVSRTDVEQFVGTYLGASIKQFFFKMFDVLTYNAKHLNHSVDVKYVNKRTPTLINNFIIFVIASTPIRFTINIMLIKQMSRYV